MMKKTLPRFLLVAAMSLALFASACSSVYRPSGTPFSDDQTYLIVKGVTGEEVLQVMDSAPHERLVLDGRETWIWVYSKGGTTKSFSVSLFNKKVEDTFTYIE